MFAVCCAWAFRVLCMCKTWVLLARVVARMYHWWQDQLSSSAKRQEKKKRRKKTKRVSLMCGTRTVRRVQ